MVMKPYMYPNTNLALIPKADANEKAIKRGPIKSSCVTNLFSNFLKNNTDLRLLFISSMSIPRSSKSGGSCSSASLFNIHGLLCVSDLLRVSSCWYGSELTVFDWTVDLLRQLRLPKQLAEESSVRRRY